MTNKNIKIVFMGTPDYACPTLKELIDNSYNIQAIFSQPDKASGRGKKILPTPTKQIALEHNIPVYQPEKLNTQQNLDLLNELKPDFFIVIAYGKILRPNFLQIPTNAPLNLHASILPLYRGAAPIQWALINGEKQTGVSLMKMDAGMDTGPVYTTESITIDPNDNAQTLHDKLAKLSAALLIQKLPLIYNNTLTPTPQSGNPSTAPTLEKSQAAIDFNQPAENLHNLIRGLSPWPSAITSYQNKRITILRSTFSNDPTNQTPGTILDLNPRENTITIAANPGIIKIHELKPEAKNNLQAKDFINGYKPKIGDQFLKI